MKHFLKIKFLFVFLCAIVLLPSSHAQEKVSGQATVKSPDNNIVVEKRVLYQIPYCLEYCNTIEPYVPEWYPAYCANGYWDYFDNYARDAVKYFYSKMNISSEQLAQHVESVKPTLEGKTPFEKYSGRYQYYYGEIWLRVKSTNERIVLLMGYQDQQMERKKDASFAKIEDNGSITFSNPFKGQGNATIHFIFEDNILKFLRYSIYQEKTGNKRMGTSFSDFTDSLKVSSNYVLSTIKDGKRIFETIENTPNGPVVKSVSDKP